ncbi:MAG: hypothetical protein HY666_01470 [Chloroflexi bacterium]|nr:hypothetical protein [Chloroflexota bacterium]
MANSSKQLYDLQVLDWEIASKNRSLADVGARLSDNQALLSIRSKLEEAQQKRKELHFQQRDLEMEADSLTGKIKEEDAKLYGGTVKSPRELADLMEEVKQLRSLEKQLEDRLLELMAESENAQNAVEELQQKLTKTEAEWEVEHQRLLQEEASLLEELSSLSQKRMSWVSVLDAPDLGLYVSLLENKQGHAVAKVERGICQGCRISLPTKDLQQARTAQRPVQCSSCGRILYVS